jgi:hypothetical protein
MNEVKYLCERALAVPAPPMRAGEDVLAQARRSTVRRQRMVAASAVAVVCAIAVLIVGRTTASPALPPVVAAPASPSWSPAPVPRAEAAPAHGHVVYPLLLAALPPGYTGSLLYPLSDDTTVYPSGQLPAGAVSLISMLATVRVVDGTGEGALWAIIVYNGHPVVAGDLCVTSPAPQTDSCTVIVVNGVPIRITTEHDNERKAVIVATRYLDGGYLSVISQQGRATDDPDTTRPSDAEAVVRAHSPVPALASPPLTPQQLAELTANPSMLPAS